MNYQATRETEFPSRAVLIEIGCYRSKLDCEFILLDLSNHLGTRRIWANSNHERTSFCSRNVSLVGRSERGALDDAGLISIGWHNCERILNG